MDIRFYIDPATGLPHIYEHGVTEADVERILRRPGEDGPLKGASRQAIGQAIDGRYLRIIYVPDAGSDSNSMFVVTAYPLTGRPLKAYRRRKRRRGR